MSNVVVSSGVRSFRRWAARWIGLFVSFVLVVTLPGAASAEPEAPAGRDDEAVRATGVPDGGSAPDVVSAGVAASVSGKPVVVESLTDEFSTTAVNPDGSFTTEQSAGPR